MPPAKKSTARKPAARSTGGRSTPSAQTTRRDVEREIARFEKHLDGTHDALQSLGKSVGRSAQGAYKELINATKTLKRNAQKTNRAVLKDFDKMRSAVTPTGARGRSATRSASRSGGRASSTRRTTPPANKK